ncbi:pentaheme c-type cytochrome TorC [Endozoicomonadaceae bacterium StTr2]
MKKLWAFLTTPTGRYSVITLLLVGAIGMASLIWTGHKSLELTGSVEFCTSCHTMEPVYKEYKQSVHFSNAAGVQAICSDCHMPQDMTGQILRKIGASNDLYQHFVTKSIDTPEQFEEKRLHLAKRVWARMEANDSSGCRKCHSYEAMDHSKQSVAAAKQMKEAAATNQTCVSCHKGVAHQLPDMSSGYRKTWAALEKMGAKPPSEEHLFSLTEIKLFADARSQQEVGKLLPATEVKVLERQGDMLNVDVTGWRDTSGRGRVLTAEAGKRIFSAALRTSQAEKVKVLDSTKIEETGKTWEKVSTNVWIRNENLLTDVNPIWDYTEELYKSTCTQCHGAPDINHFSSTEWIAQLKGMMSFADLSKREERTLLKYLQNHGSDSAAGGAH